MRYDLTAQERPTRRQPAGRGGWGVTAPDGSAAMTTEPTRSTNYFALYGVPRDAAFVEAIRHLATHVRDDWAYPMSTRVAALRVLDDEGHPDPSFVEDLVAVLFAVHRNPDADWEACWWCGKLTRWICAVRRIDPASGRREARDVRH